MMRLSLLLLASTFCATGAFRAVTPLVGARFARRATTPLAMLPPLPELFSTFSIAVGEITSGLEEPTGDTFADVATVFLFGFLMSKLFSGLHEAGSASSTPKADEGLRSFGWLQADHRIPLPAIDDLSDGCHLVGNDGTRQMFLCKPDNHDDFGICELSDDFSAFYGQEVLVCAGSSVN